MARPFARGSGGAFALVVAFFSLLSLLGLSAAPQASATSSGAATTDPIFGGASGTSYNIVARHSGRCLSVQGESLVAGAAIVQEDCTGGLGERWRLEEDVTGGGSFRIVNTQSNMCVGVRPPVGTAARILQLSACDPANDIVFKSVDRGTHAWLQSISVSPAKCAEIRRGAQVPGVPVRLGDCAEGPGVKFFTRPVSNANAVPESGFGTVERVNVGLGDAQTVGELGDKSDSNSISGNGRYVAFEAKAPGLVPGDANGFWDVFVRDLGTGETTRVSVSSTGAEGNNFSREPSISEDGRYVAFRSKASNLAPNDTNNDYDVFVHDRDTGVTEIISRSAAGTLGDGQSASPLISADGRYVAFDSFATNLVPGDTNVMLDAFVRDRKTNTIERVSVSSSETQGDLFSGAPMVTPDGKYVVFLSRSTNLVPGTTHTAATFDVYLRDRTAGTTVRISNSTTGNGANGMAGDPSISKDGRYVVFHSKASNMLPGGQDTNNMSDVYSWDRTTNAITRVSMNADGSQSLMDSVEPSMSTDGRYIAFTSGSDSMVDFDTNGVADVFVKDRTGGSLLRVSVDHLGRQGNAASQYANLSGNGEQLLFHSDATNLDSGDTNAARDVFTRPRPRP